MTIRGVRWGTPVLLVNGAADLLAGFWRKLFEKIDDLFDDFLFEPCGISGSSDFGMATTYVSGNVPGIVELAANLAFYGCWHLETTPGPRFLDAAGIFHVSFRTSTAKDAAGKLECGK
jgi:hypothetical protein